jgi:hypothetical protein
MGLQFFIFSEVTISFSTSHAINKVTHENKQPKSKKPNYKQQPRKFQDKPVLTTSSTLHKECRFCGYKHENI